MTDVFPCPGCSPRPETVQHPVCRRQRLAREPAHLWLWFRQTAEGRERSAHDALLHRQLCRAWGQPASLFSPYCSASCAFDSYDGSGCSSWSWHPGLFCVVALIGIDKSGFTVFEGLGKFGENGISFSRPWKSVKTEWGLWKFVNFVVFRALGKNDQLISQKQHFPRPNSR